MNIQTIKEHIGDVIKETNLQGIGERKVGKVRDIYDPDGQLTLKVQPPLPLQAVTTNWGARDANWFFDFSSSAKDFRASLSDSSLLDLAGYGSMPFFFKSCNFFIRKARISSIEDIVHPAVAVVMTLL